MNQTAEIIQSPKLFDEDLMLMVDRINGAKDMEAALSWLRKIEVAKRALEVADEFKRQSVKYAKLEAMALVKVVALGGQNEIRPTRRKKAALWLAQMSERERDAIVSECFDGRTIEMIYRDEIEKPRQTKKAKVTVQAYEEAVIDSFDSFGMVTLKAFDEKLDELPISETLAKGVKNVIRDKLRRRGAVGLGDGNGTYVNRSDGNQVSQAISLRIMSIERDIVNLISLAEELSAEHKPEVFVNTLNNQTTDMPVYDTLAILLASFGVVRVKTTTPLKEARILNRIIRSTFPDFYRSTELFDAIFRRCVECGTVSFADEPGSIPAYVSNWEIQLAERKNNERRAAAIMEKMMAGEEVA